MPISAKAEAQTREPVDVLRTIDAGNAAMSATVYARSLSIGKVARSDGGVRHASDIGLLQGRFRDRCCLSPIGPLDLSLYLLRKLRETFAGRSLWSSRKV